MKAMPNNTARAAKRLLCEHKDSCKKLGRAALSHNPPPHWECRDRWIPEAHGLDFLAKAVGCECGERRCLKKGRSG